jgi:hypothetical protein
MTNDWIITYTGKKFYPLKPNIEDINILDIATSLSNQCRFTGHTSQFYSVADHCLRVTELCSPENKLWALLHDASEAYLIDLPKPIKIQSSMAPYREVEEILMRFICRRFGLSIKQPQQVTDNDWLMCCTEIYHLMTPGLIKDDPYYCSPLHQFHLPLTPDESRKKFLGEFAKLY